MQDTVGQDDKEVSISLNIRSSDVEGHVKQNVERLTKEREALQSERAEYLQMRKSVGEVHLKDPITLDIGGNRFKTTLGTLRRDKGSMLAAMFSGNGFKLTPADDGSYFIDRDGTHFRHILNYLRGCFSVSTLSKDVIDELSKEADFYHLEGLLTLLCPPTITLEPSTIGNGVFHYVGGGDQWTNPATTGKVAVSGTLLLLSETIGRSPNPGTGHCEDARGKFIVVDLKDSMLRPSHMSLAHNGNCCRGATWVLEGEGTDSPAESWTQLFASATDGSALSGGGTTPCLFSLPSPVNAFYRRFKLRCSGQDQCRNCHCFHVGQFELHGELSKMPDELLPNAKRRRMPLG